jgi:hypothetical protein
MELPSKGELVRTNKIGIAEKKVGAWRYIRREVSVILWSMQ